jgi:L-seryl-tRNA(Ser) seleniumtransferase
MDRGLTGSTVYERLGTRPIINACGIYTDLGGSRLSPAVWAAMAEANASFVSMADLLEGSGRVLADALGAEAGRVVPGAAAAIALMTSAAMTGVDRAASEQLPDTTGLRGEVVLQRNHRYKYDRLIRLAGARLRLAGDERGTTAAELEAAIGPATAALFLPAHLDGRGGTVPLREAVPLARRQGVAVLVDAAYQCWPLDAMRSSVPAGADLVCFSAKYFGGPNAGGFVVGTRARIDAVIANEFIGYESGPHRAFGRPFKMDRQTVVGVVAAFQEWLSLDHGARWDRYRGHVERLGGLVAGLPGLAATPMHFAMDESLVPEPVNALVLEVGAESGTTAARLARDLATGTPSIACVRDGDRLIFCLDLVDGDEVVLIGRRIRELVRGER